MPPFSTKCLWSSASTLAATALLALLASQVHAESDDDGWGMDDDLAASVTLGPWAGDLNVGPGMKATGRNLRGSRFVCQDLTGAVFDGCDLYGVSFLSCDLAKASFRGTDLTEASIDECRVRRADFTDTTINGLREALLSEGQLKSTRSYKTRDLHHCPIASYPDGNPEDADYPPPYDFRGANLRGAILRGDFRKCDFTDARIEHIVLRGGKIASSQLASTATYKDRNLWGITVWMLIEGNLDLSGMNLARGKLGFKGQAVNLTDAIVSETELSITYEALSTTKSYKEGDLVGITWQQVDFSSADLSGRNLTGSNFERCWFTNAKLDNAVITNAHFGAMGSGRCPGLTVEQIKSTWNYKNGRMAGIVLPKDIAEALQKEKDSEKDSKK